MDERGRRMTRTELLRHLSGLIDDVELSHPVRVAVDGPDAAGKTTLAEELAVALRGSGREVIRASIDGFHRPRSERYRRGPDSPVGYYEDSFDFEAVRACLLDPLGPGGNLQYRTAAFDYREDAPRAVAPVLAPENAVLVFDGVFLLRPELRDAWDLRIFVSAGFDVTLRRALSRDVALFGSEAEVERRYRTRYLPGQKLYRTAAHPEQAADAVVFNDDPARPLLRLRRPRSASRER